jgi:hypothetical protein
MTVEHPAFVVIDINTLTDPTPPHRRNRPGGGEV